METDTGRNGCHWCFTVNNWTPLDKATLDALKDQVKYLVYGDEVGAQGTPHLQGYVIMNKNQRFSAMKKLLPAGAHIEYKRGSEVQASTYCLKDGHFTEYGTRPMTKAQQGQLEKDRWTNARRLAEQGKLEEIDDELYIRYRSTFHKIAESNPVRPPMLEELTCEWWYGPTGCGKSYTAEQLPDRFDKPINKWWDGFHGQANTVIEEFGPEHAYMGPLLKQWCDKYAFAAEVKQGTITIRPSRIIIVSNYHPSEVFPDQKVLDPLLRKLKLRLFDTPYDPLAPPPNKRPKI